MDMQIMRDYGVNTDFYNLRFDSDGVYVVSKETGEERSLNEICSEKEVYKSKFNEYLKQIFILKRRLRKGIIDGVEYRIQKKCINQCIKDLKLNRSFL